MASLSILTVSYFTTCSPTECWKLTSLSMPGQPTLTVWFAISRFYFVSNFLAADLTLARRNRRFTPAASSASISWTVQVPILPVCMHYQLAQLLSPRYTRPTRTGPFFIARLFRRQLRDHRHASKPGSWAHMHVMLSA